MRRSPLTAAIAASCLLSAAPSLAQAPSAPSTPAQPLPTMIELERQMTAVVDRVRPSVVMVVGEKQPPAGPPRAGVRPTKHVSVASGVVLDQRGHVITTTSVTRRGQIFRVVVHGQEYPAEVVADDPVSRLALLLVRGGEAFVPLPLAAATDLHIGSWVFLVGAGPTETPTTFGSVSSLPRPDDDPNRHFMATTAAMTPGLTGAAFVNSRGELVGIAYAAVVGQTAETETLDGEPRDRTLLAPSSTSLAIPIDTIREVAEMVRARGTIARAFLGVRWNPDEPRDLTTTLPSGVHVWDVIGGSPAEKAGVRKGDVVTRFNDQPVRSGPELRTLILSASPGERAHLGLLRDGAPLTVTVLLEPLTAAAVENAGAPDDR